MQPLLTSLNLLKWKACKTQNSLNKAQSYPSLNFLTKKSHYSLHPCGLRGLSSSALLWAAAFITLRSHAGDTQGTARLYRPANCSLPDPDWAQLRPEQNSSAYHHNEEQLLSVRATTKALQMIQRLHANMLTSLCSRWKQHVEIVFEFTVFIKQVKKYIYPDTISSEILKCTLLSHERIYEWQWSNATDVAKSHDNDNMINVVHTDCFHTTHMHNKSVK